jgi:hypothetical protein
MCYFKVTLHCMMNFMISPFTQLSFLFISILGLPKGSSTVGIYVCQFYTESRIYFVVVDDRLPVDESGRVLPLYINASSRGNEHLFYRIHSLIVLIISHNISQRSASLWPLILHKAFTKFNFYIQKRSLMSLPRSLFSFTGLSTKVWKLNV